MEERASYENHKFPEGMPTGPWKSDVEAKMDINKYAHCYGFSVIFRTILLPSNQKRGRRRHVCWLSIAMEILMDQNVGQ